MSQYRELGEDSGKMAISYASGLPADHTPALPSFREVRQHTTPGKTDRWFRRKKISETNVLFDSYSRLISMTRSNRPHISLLASMRASGLHQQPTN